MESKNGNASSKGKSRKQAQVKSGSEKRFCAAISLSNGVVQHTTKSFSQAVGYPKDMWVGRNILDFVHPDDQESFSRSITESLHMEMIGQSKQTFCTRLKQYKGLHHTGFAVKSHKRNYNPFKLSTFFQGQEISPIDTTLFLIAEPIQCAYSVPLQAGPITTTSGQSSFCTQLKSDFTIGWVDDHAISFTGFLDRELIGQSIINFTHPSDHKALNKIFKEIMAKKIHNGESEEVRMIIRNKASITLNSTWTSFVNPWSRKLELVMGRHTVLQGPDTTANFFQDAPRPDFTDTRRFLPRPAAVAASKSRVVAALPRVTPTFTLNPSETPTKGDLDLDNLFTSSSGTQSEDPQITAKKRRRGHEPSSTSSHTTLGVRRSDTLPESKHEKNMSKILPYFEGSLLYSGLKTLYPRKTQETKTTKTVGARPGNGESDSSDLYTFLHTSVEPASSDMITLPSSNEEKDETKTKPKV